MPSSGDLDRLRPLLEADRPWSLYLLGDLEPHLRPHCQWWCNEEAVVLLYRRFATPVFLALGPADAVGALLDEIPLPPVLHLHVRPEILPLIQAIYDVPTTVAMIRMWLAPGAFRSRRTADVVPLRARDEAAVAALYADGDATDEAPDFYAPEMLDDGIFFGVRRDGELVGVAGTHLVGWQESVAAIGNVYTRRDHRGRGLAAATTSAVIEELVAKGARTIGLSVAERNGAAQRIYRQLGFVEHCPFIEGRAVARHP